MPGGAGEARGGSVLGVSVRGAVLSRVWAGAAISEYSKMSYIRVASHLHSFAIIFTDECRH